MNSEGTLQSEIQEDYEQHHTTNISQHDYPFYYQTQNYRCNDKYQNDFSAHNIDNNSLQEEDSKYEDSNNTQPSQLDTQTRFDQDTSVSHQILKQYQTQNMNSQMFQNHNKLMENSRDKALNMFSNSFDESAPSFDLRPQRNCKSSTRKMNKTQKRQAINPQIPIPIIQNMSSGVLTAGSLNRKQGAFNSYMRQKQQIQNTYQQSILNQLQRANTQNSFDMKNTGQDLSNRSLILTPGTQQVMNNSFYALNHYLYGTQISSNNKPITPHQNNAINNSNQAFQSVILSAGGTMNPRNNQMNQTTMDPYTYLRWKQQKYKSCRSIQASNGQIQTNQQQVNPNQTQSFQNQRKGNQTQKNNKSTCSSNGSAFNTSTTTMVGPIKNLTEVRNPQYFISFRFNDRKIKDLTGIKEFKNLSELDISGNLLTEEISELKQLQFLKKLNMSNNTITEMHCLPQNLEILNLSYNSIKKINPDVTSQLKNLTTLDISNNNLEDLNGIQNLKRLKRLILKNNQINDLSSLQEIVTLIELDLENNPLTQYSKILDVLINKKDILVVNLKQVPIMQTIQSYDQLLAEVQTSLNENSLDKINQIIDYLKKKLKFYFNGCLFRSKRAYLKIKTVQQHSKRSSSNFSNESSSCGRGNTGGRVNKMNNSQGNAFSPLINNMMNTPNQGQKTSQRFEDIEQVYDEILDEEEELERKLLRIQKRKQKKNGEQQQNNYNDDSCDEDEDESLYEDEDEIHPSMSFEDDIDDLQSYRNHHNNNHQNEFLNESTADFNKEIRQINQELKEQLENELVDQVPDHLHSLHSTQSINTNFTKKNPISFKLDLSKCRQQQQDDEEEFDQIDDLNGGQLNIPGLQYVKVTDDSFRQFQKQVSQQQSVRSQKVVVAEQSTKNTLREYPPKPIQKQVFIPKLQLGALQQSNMQTNIPLKPTQSSTLNSAALKNKVQQMKSYRTEQITPQPIPQLQQEIQLIIEQPKTSECQNEQCSKLRDEIQQLKQKYDNEKKENEITLNLFKNIIEEIKGIFNFNEDFKDLPLFIKNYQSKQSNTINEKEQIQLQFDDLNLKFNELTYWKQNYENISSNKNNELITKCQENEKTIQKLRDQLAQLDKQYSSEYNIECEFLNSQNKNDIKRTLSNQYEQDQQQLLNNPQFFYNSTVNQIIISDRNENVSNTVEIENMNKSFNKKKLTCDFRKIKRPSSVAAVGQRKTSNGIKINNLLKIEQSSQLNLNFTNLENSSQPNDYNSNLEYDTNVENQQFSQTMNKKVGHYIQRLKERNSSLQERLNGSFSNNGNHSALKRASPVDLNITTYHNDSINNAYVLSPTNDTVNKSFQPQSTTHHNNSGRQQIPSFSSMIKKISNKDINNDNTNKITSKQTNHNSNEYNTDRDQESKQHSKTQRIHVNRIQYNQINNNMNKNDSKILTKLQDSERYNNANNSSFNIGSTRIRDTNQMQNITVLKGSQVQSQMNMQNRQNNI